MTKEVSFNLDRKHALMDVIGYLKSEEKDYNEIGLYEDKEHHIYNAVRKLKEIVNELEPNFYKTKDSDKKINDSGWLQYGTSDYDDSGFQTYFKSPVLYVRFWGEDWQHYDVLTMRQITANTDPILIVSNEYGIKEGDYSIVPSLGTKTIFELLKEHYRNPDKMKFLIDMIEV